VLTKVSRFVFVPGVPAVPAFAGGTFCTPAPVPQPTCGPVTICYEVPLPAGNIPPTSTLCYPTVVNCTPPAGGAGTIIGGAPQNCAYYPPRPGVPAVPSRYDAVGDRTWNAGANSIDELSGDVEVQMDMPRVIGVCVGFVATRALPTDPNRVLYGLRFGLSETGASVMHVSEQGQRRTADAAYAPSDVFRIRRVGGSVSYLRNGEVIYASLRPSAEPVLMVGAALFGFGDAIP
jgi:hypothetical protein